jgi:hypothetical protein
MKSDHQIGIKDCPRSRLLRLDSAGPSCSRRIIAIRATTSASPAPLSLWENEAAMRTYENGEILQNTILPRL